MATCAQEIAAPVYLGRDNAISLVLYRDGAVLSDLSAVTRVTVDLDGGTTVIDSDTAPEGTITWTAQQTHRGSLVDVLRLTLGGESIATGSYDDVEIVLYDATYTDGLQLENALTITVHA